MRTCLIDGCEKPAKKRGWCGAHYELFRRTGAIPIDRERDPEVRFWRKVAKSEGCWQWNAATVPGGYGRVYFGGRIQQAHRVAYELLIGPIPDGLHLDHLCRNRGCVNPAHLEPVTPGENVLRGVGPSALHAVADACIHGHPFTLENTHINAKGWRLCRECNRRRAREAAARKRKPYVRNVDCVNCGKSFVVVGKLRRCCSDQCRLERNREHARNHQRRKRAGS